ncbi:MAG: FHA domain-containing protein [Polyangiaceae bacterium]
MISCPKCGKENQDHYKFCLGCGAELPRDASPKPFSSNTPPQGVKAVSKDPSPTTPQGAGQGGFGLNEAPSQQGIGAAPPSAAAASAAPATGGGGGAAGTSACPQCGHQNAPNNVFCGSCGFRLGGAPAQTAQPPVVAPTSGGGVVMTALRADGSEAGTYNMPAGDIVLGRDSGSIFAGDSYLSPKHASFRQPGPGKLHVKDEDSLNGVYRKLARDVPVTIRPGDVFRIGQEIIKFESLAPQPAAPDGVERLGAPSKGYIGRIALVIGRDTTGNAFPIPEGGIHLGRERGDVLFPEDGYVSGLHCHLSWDGSKLSLTDLGSSNGTFVRIYEEVEVTNGDVLLMGQQLFRVNL